MALYGEIQKAVEFCLLHEEKRHVTVVIDDVSLMEVVASGSSDLVLDFLHYCYSLTAQFVSTQVVHFLILYFCLVYAVTDMKMFSLSPSFS